MSAHASPLRLGELDLPSPTDALFQLGELLARTNAAGGLLSPLRLDQVSLTLPLSRWDFKTAACITPGAFTPAHAAQQFVELDDESLLAILGGYARLAYQLLDPTYQGFTDSLLAQLLPGVEVKVPRPEPIRFDMAAVLQAYNTMLEPDMEAPQLQFAAPRPPATPPSEEDVLLATLVLFVDQRNLTAWLRQVAACEPKRKLAQVLGALAQGKFYTSSWDGLIPRLLTWVMPRKTVRQQVASSSPLVVAVLDILAEAYAEPDRLSGVNPFRIVRATLDHLPPDSPDSGPVRTALLTGILDGLHALAKQADVNGQMGASILFANNALLALQLLPTQVDPAQAEAWLARMQAQESTYQWSRLAPDQPLDSASVWSFGGYAGAARLVASLLGDLVGPWYSQGRVSNQFWTAAWFGLERLRLGLRLFYALSQQEPLPVGPARQQATLSLQYLLDHYHQAQQELATMLSRNLQLGRERSIWVQTMIEEGSDSLDTTQVGYDLRALTPVQEALRRHGYGPEVVAQLGQLAASLVPVVAGNRPVPPVAAPEDPLCAYGVEEEQVYQQVLTRLLHQAYVAHAGQLQRADGSPLIPLPPNPLSGAMLAAYREAWLAQHPTVLSPPGVLNLSPTLHSLVNCLAEYRFLLDQPALPAQNQALHQLASEPGVAALGTRPFAPAPPPAVWRYTCYWRYAPFQQYPQPLGSQGTQVGLRLSRVGFNATRDTGFFFYDLDYGTHILGNVALVRKQAGRWVLQADA